MNHDGEADAPLDPALERVRRKMIRLLAISIAMLFVGLIAVLAAVVHRATRDEAPAAAAPAAGSVLPVALPAGARVADTALDGGRALLRVLLADGTEELRLVDLATGALLSRHPLRAEPPVPGPN